MRTIIANSAIIASASAINMGINQVQHQTTSQVATPDVFGPNGNNYTNTAPTVDMSKVGISISEAGSGDMCTDGKWAKIAYKGFLTNGQQVMGSEEVDNKDLIFSVGAAQTFKCFDLALTQLKPGSKARISCPSELVNGGAVL